MTLFPVLFSSSCKTPLHIWAQVVSVEVFTAEHLWAGLLSQATALWVLPPDLYHSVIYVTKTKIILVAVAERIG